MVACSGLRRFHSMARLLTSPSLPACVLVGLQGGTVASAVSLVEKLGGVVIACLVVIELPICEGRQRIVKECGIKTEDVHTILTY